MNALTTILPVNATATERAIEGATARIGEAPVPNADLWNPATCPAALLPWLAWALSVDDWDANWTEDRKREVIAAAVYVHRHKGTVASIRTAIDKAGFAGAELRERWSASLHDGSFAHTGARTYAPGDHWAEYRVVLTAPISLKQAAWFRAQLARVAPARCHLKALSYLQALNIYNAAITYDGAYSHGVA